MQYLGWELGHPMRILLVEDNEANRLVARLLLEREGHIVICAENGEIALAQCKGIKFDLILMDIMMPIMDGIKTLGHLRRHETPNKDTPVFALTAYCSPYDRKYYKHIGFNHVLLKPLKVGDIDADWKASEAYSTQEKSINAAQNLANPRKSNVLHSWKDIKRHVRLIELSLAGALKNDIASLNDFRNAGERLATSANQAGFHKLAAIAHQLETASYNILTALMPTLLKNLDEALLELTEKHIKDSSLANHSYDANAQIESNQIQTSRL